MTAIHKALIVGGGIGGLSAAIALRRIGVDVDLVEISTHWKVYHVGIIVQGNFVRAMEALGIVDEAVAIGFPSSGVIFQTLHGHVLADIPGLKIASPQYPSDLGMARPALHGLLSGTARQLGTNIRLGTTFDSIAQDGESVHVSFSDGTRGIYDLVIGADGLHSTVRATLFGNTIEPTFTGQGVWRYNVPRPPQLTRIVVSVGLKGGKVGFVPLTQETGYIFLVQSEPGNPHHPPEQLANIFRQRLAECTGVMAQLREHITDSTQVVYRPLKSLLLPAPWFKGRVVLLGDAAHATTPHLGQGAAQAVEDAVVLADVARKHGAIEPALAEYMQRRFERCKFIHDGSLQLGQWEQHPPAEDQSAALTGRMMQMMAQPI